jgi:NAD(P)-dependent dehydrogenase (short-subunit alcohol dehydrogenase family)
MSDDRERCLMTSLSGKVAVVTGAGSGIGEATAELLVERGAKVVVADIDEAAGHKVADRLGKSAIAHRTDVTFEADVDSMVEAAVTHFGRLDLAVNNAGIGDTRQLHTTDIDLESWRRVTAVDLDGVLLCMKAEIPAMLAAGGGSIVNMASMFGVVSMPGGGAYSAAKHGVVGLTRSAALEYSPRGLRINAVSPGVIESPLTASRPDVRDAVAALHPIGRLGTPREVASVVAFVHSDEASFVTGAFYSVDGGYTAQ